ncbi:hypothetical protein MKY95_32675 [Paenibacillus sp. FSL P4-0176]
MSAFPECSNFRKSSSSVSIDRLDMHRLTNLDEWSLMRITNLN